MPKDESNSITVLGLSSSVNEFTCVFSKKI